MRRRRTSSRPAAASKYHLPSRSTSGMGIGQSAGPTESTAVVFVESNSSRCFCRASAAKAVAVLRSCTVSSDSTRSAPPPPRMSFSAGTSNFSAAATSAAAALSGVANSRGGVVSAGGADSPAESERLASPHPARRPRTPAAVPRRRARCRAGAIIDGALLRRRPACHLRHRARPCCSRRGSCWPARCRRRSHASRR